MLLLTVFLLTIGLKIALTVACAMLCFYIARMELTPTGSYVWYCVSYSVLLVVWIHTLQYPNNVSDFLESFNKPATVKSQIAWVIFLSIHARQLSKQYKAVSFVHNK